MSREKKLKILHTVEFYSPSVGGAQEVVKQLSEHMAALGHDVTVATTKLPERTSKTINGVKIRDFDVGGNAVRGYYGSEINKYQEFLAKGNFDIIMNYAAQQWTTDLTFEIIDQIKAKKYLVPCGYSGLYDPAYKKYFTQLPAILEKYTKSIYLSDSYRDITFARKHRVKNTILIPNGADEREFTTLPSIDRDQLFRKYGIPQSSKIILCVSNHTGQKGHKEAISSFLKANISDAALVFVGDINLHAGCYRECVKSEKINYWLEKILRKDRKSIHNLHVSRAETLKIFSASYFFLFLSNIECSPLVLFEASASGKPFIATDCGNSAEIATWLGNGIIVNTIPRSSGYVIANESDAAKHITSLFNNPSKVQTIGQSARSIWQKKYTWDKLTKKFVKMYSS